MDSPVRSGEEKPFTGAVLQSFLMFVGESLCYILWFVDYMVSKRQGAYPLCDFVEKHSDLEGKQSHWWWWVLPAFLDCVASTLMNVAYTITYASTVQMLRNFMVVIGAVLQLVIVRKALRWHEYCGVALITGAMFLAAVPAIQNPDDSAVEDSNAALGVLFSLLGTSIQALQLTFEDYLFRNKGRISPLKAVGIEGVSGLVITCAIMMPACEYTDFDPVWDSFHQWVGNGAILGVSIAYVFCATLFNASGLCCTKLATGLLRAVIFAVRAPIVWFFDLGLGWLDYDNYNLGSVFVFAFGFALFINVIPWKSVICGTVGQSLDDWLTHAPHWCCTKPELDDDYVAPEEDEDDENTIPAVAKAEPIV